MEMSGRVARAGYPVIVDAVFAKPAERAALEAVAQAANVSFEGYFLTADIDTRLRRIGGRVNDASDADAKVARHQQDYDLGDMGWTEIDASGTPAQTARTCPKVE